MVAVGRAGALRDRRLRGDVRRHPPGAAGVTGRRPLSEVSRGIITAQHDYAFFNSDSQLGKVLPKWRDRADPRRVPACRTSSNALVTVLPFNQPEIFREAMRRHRGEFRGRSSWSR